MKNVKSEAILLTANEDTSNPGCQNLPGAADADDLRRAIGAIFFLCAQRRIQWRYLPAEFPPWRWFIVSSAAGNAIVCGLPSMTYGASWSGNLKWNAASQPPPQAGGPSRQTFGAGAGFKTLPPRWGVNHVGKPKPTGILLAVFL